VTLTAPGLVQAQSPEQKWTEANMKRLNGQTFSHQDDQTGSDRLGNKNGREFNVDNGQVAVLEWKTTIATEERDGISFPVVTSRIKLRVTAHYHMKRFISVGKEYRSDIHEVAITYELTWVKDASGSRVQDERVVESSPALTTKPCRRRSTA